MPNTGLPRRDSHDSRHPSMPSADGNLPTGAINWNRGQKTPTENQEGPTVNSVILSNVAGSSSASSHTEVSAYGLGKKTSGDL